MHLGISKMVWDRAEYIAYAASYTRMVPFLQAKATSYTSCKTGRNRLGSQFMSDLGFGQENRLRSHELSDD